MAMEPRTRETSENARGLGDMIFSNPDRFDQYIAEAQAADFSGWDFGWLEGRMIQEDPPWDYLTLVKSYFKQTHSLLDMGTGGGELLASLAPLPPDVHATESFQLNIGIAQKRLSPLNVRVHAIDECELLPFNDAYFDLVINRHESFDLDEVSRVLKPGGTFITQQVSGLDNLELNQVLEADFSFPFFHWSLESTLIKLYEKDWAVELAEKAAPRPLFWISVPSFITSKPFHGRSKASASKPIFEGLVRVHNIIEKQGKFESTAHRFLIVAKKKERTI